MANDKNKLNVAPVISPDILKTIMKKEFDMYQVI